MTRACSRVARSAAVLCIAFASSRANAQAARAVKARLDTARVVRTTAQTRAAAGDHRTAVNEYGRVIATMSSVPAQYKEKAVLADAHVGRASSVLQLGRAGAIELSTAGGTGDLASAIKDYVISRCAGGF